MAAIKRKTWRVRGLDVGCGSECLQRLWEGAPDIPSFQVHSLALEYHGLSQTATVSFGDNLEPPQHLGYCQEHPGQLEAPDLDDHFLGLTTLFRPPDEDHQLDVVALPGLGWHAFASFKDRSSYHMWLRDALPFDLVGEQSGRPMARVIIFGYSSTVANSTSMLNVNDLTAAFHSQLLGIVSSQPMRPMLTIAHSLSGLILKQTIIMLCNSTDSKSAILRKAIRGIVFFGVPHHDMDTSILVAMAGSGSHLELTTSIGHRSSNFLLKQSVDFPEALVKAGQPEVFCFYETEKSPTAVKLDEQWSMAGKMTVLVSVDSATGCLSATDIFKHSCAINRSHSEIIKFAPHDEVYDAVLQKLQGVAERAVSFAGSGMGIEQAILIRPLANENHASNLQRRVIQSIPMMENKNFTGREMVLTELRSSFFPAAAGNKRRNTMALMGLGGIGKTQVALAFSYWVKKHKPDYSIFWLYAESIDMFEQSCAGVLRELGFPIKKDDKQDVKAQLKKYLSESLKTGQWLLVLDDADDVSLLEGTPQRPGIAQYLPHSNESITLITTRSMNVADTMVSSRDIVRLTLLLPAEAQLLLAETLETSKIADYDDKTSRELVEALELLPLAIVQAAAYLNRTQTSIQEYLGCLQGQVDKATQLLSREFNPEERWSLESQVTPVIAPILVSLDQIKRKDQAQGSDATMKLLMFLSQVEPRVIPRWMLPLDGGSAEALADTIGNLLNYSLLAKRGGDAPVYDMHRLVHLAICSWTLREQLLGEALAKTLQHLHILMPFDDPMGRAVWTALMPHALRALARASEGHSQVEASFWLAHRVSWCLEQDGHYGKALRWARYCSEGIAAMHAEQSVQWQDAQLRLGAVYLGTGRLAAALLVLTRVMASLQQTRSRNGEMDDKRLQNARIGLAEVYSELGQHRRARALLRDVLASVSEDDSLRLTASHNLANTYLASGEPRRAIPHFEHVATVQARTLPLEHPARLGTEHNLAFAYLDVRLPQKALPLLSNAVAVQLKILSPAHPNLLASQHLLANAHLADGDPQPAVSLLEHLANAGWETHSDRIYDRLRSRYDLANAYLATAHVKEALVWLNKAIQLAPALPGDNQSLSLHLHALELLDDVLSAIGTTDDAAHITDEIRAVKARLDSFKTSNLTGPDGMDSGDSDAAEPEGKLSLDYAISSSQLPPDSGYGTRSVVPTTRIATTTNHDQLAAHPETESEHGSEIRADSHVSDGDVGDDELETQTVFSDSGSLAQHGSRLSDRLADKVLTDLGHDSIASKSTGTGSLELGLSAIVKDFALNIAHDVADQLSRDTMLYVYTNSEQIVSSLLHRPVEDQDQTPSPSKIDHELMYERRMKMWDNLPEEAPEALVEPHWTQEALETMETESAAADEGQINSVDAQDLFPFEKYVKTLDGSEAYAWLLANIRRETLMQHTIPDYRAEVKQQIIKSLPQQRVSRSKQPQAHDIRIEFQWDVRDFFKRQIYELSDHEVARHVIVLVGSETDAQATTCVEYLMQTWPSTGERVMDCFVDCLRKGTSSANFTRDHRLQLHISERTLISEIHGNRAFACEISEQLTWLGAALQYNRTDPDSMCISRPLFEFQRTVPTSTEESGANTTRNFRVTYLFEDFHPDSAPLHGQCWHGLFRNAVVVEGFPIPIRDVGAHTGLDMTLQMMASLAQAPLLNTFQGTPMIKGFSTLLVPTQQKDCSTVWHLTYNMSGEYISFAEGLSCFAPCFDATQLLDPSRRHYLGWCSDAKLYAGAVDAVYSVNGTSMARVTEGCMLHGATIKPGIPLHSGSQKDGTKDQAKHLSHFEPHRHRETIQRFAEQKVIIWDDCDKRAWLIDGASALLHLLRAWAERELRDDCDFLLRPECFTESKVPYTSISASQFLKNKNNLDLPLYAGEDEKQTFRDQVIRFGDMLQQMETHAKRKGSPRRFLEGWDFCEVILGGASERTAYVEELPPQGRNWTDFQRWRNYVVIVGKGFGELIQPEPQPGNKPANTCKWATVPRNSYYLTALLRDVKGLGNDKTSSGILTTHIQSTFSWHNPGGKIFKPCRCSDPILDVTQEQQHDDYVQVLLPLAKTDECAVSEHIDISSDSKGAIIFGYSKSFSWVFGNFGPPEFVELSAFIDSAHPSTHDSGYSSPFECTRGPRPPKPEIGIFCALPKEMKAVRTLLSCEFRHADEDDKIVRGHLHGHSVVIFVLPFGDYGIRAAATAIENFGQDFPGLEFTLVIGIGAGIPSEEADVRLGDVVVGLSENKERGGLLELSGKLEDGTLKVRAASLVPPPVRLTRVIAKWRSDHQPETQLHEFIEKIIRRDDQYRSPGHERDILYVTRNAQDNNTHNSAPLQWARPAHGKDPRLSQGPKIHYGTILSSNNLIKDASARDSYAANYRAICIDMEGAAIASAKSCLVIRGICDYADSQKDKVWQDYAAAVAAAYAMCLVSRLAPAVPTAKGKRKRSLENRPFQAFQPFQRRLSESSNASSRSS